MWELLTTAVMLVTVAITGYWAAVFLRDPEWAMEKATHRLDLLPRVMTGRYIAIFLLALGALINGEAVVAAWFLAACAVLGLWDGWVYWREGLPHIKHTITGLLAVGGLGVAVLAVLAGA